LESLRTAALNRFIDTHLDVLEELGLVGVLEQLCQSPPRYLVAATAQQNYQNLVLRFIDQSCGTWQGAVDEEQRYRARIGNWLRRSAIAHIQKIDALSPYSSESFAEQRLDQSAAEIERSQRAIEEVRKANRLRIAREQAHARVQEEEEEEEEDEEAQAEEQYDEDDDADVSLHAKQEEGVDSEDPEEEEEEEPEEEQQQEDDVSAAAAAHDNDAESEEEEPSEGVKEDEDMHDEEEEDDEDAAGASVAPLAGATPVSTTAATLRVSAVDLLTSPAFPPASWVSTPLAQAQFQPLASPISPLQQQQRQQQQQRRRPLPAGVFASAAAATAAVVADAAVSASASRAHSYPSVVEPERLRRALNSFIAHHHIALEDLGLTGLHFRGLDVLAHSYASWAEFEAAVATTIQKRLASPQSPAAAAAAIDIVPSDSRGDLLRRNIAVLLQQSFTAHLQQEHLRRPVASWEVRLRAILRQIDHQRRLLEASLVREMTLALDAGVTSHTRGRGGAANGDSGSGHNNGSAAAAMLATAQLVTAASAAVAAASSLESTSAAEDAASADQLCEQIKNWAQRMGNMKRSLDATVPLQQRVLALTAEVASLRAQTLPQDAAAAAAAPAAFVAAASARTFAGAAAAGAGGAAAAADVPAASGRAASHKRKAGKQIEAAAKKQRAEARSVGLLLESRPPCSVCREVLVSPGVFQPCGHLAACVRCALNYHASNDCCPHCRKEVTQVQRIHFT
jgi:hypothetical protein